MALWLEPGSEPETQREADDLAAINAIKVSAAVELKVLSFLFYIFLLFLIFLHIHTLIHIL